MKRSIQLLTGLSVCAILLIGSMPAEVHAHGGIGGFHAGGVHVGGVHAGGFHAGGIHAGGFNHVGYYPHYHPGVGYYHPVARAAAWNAAYNNDFGYGGYNPYPYQPQQVPSFSTGSSAGASGDGSSGANPLKAAAEQAQQKLDAELNSGGKDK